MLAHECYLGHGRASRRLLRHPSLLLLQRDDTVFVRVHRQELCLCQALALVQTVCLGVVDFAVLVDIQGIELRGGEGRRLRRRG